MSKIVKFLCFPIVFCNKNLKKFVGLFTRSKKIENKAVYTNKAKKVKPPIRSNQTNSF